MSTRLPALIVCTLWARRIVFTECFRQADLRTFPWVPYRLRAPRASMGVSLSTRAVVRSIVSTPAA